MRHSLNRLLITSVFAVLLFGACSNGDAQNTKGTEPKPQATPAKTFAAADIEKLKWLEGTWRGMDGYKPFYERYRFDGTSMIVETLTDETLSKAENTGRYELKDGEFGKGEGDERSAASEITADHVQFVPAVPGKRNSYRFERQADGTWKAILEWPATEKRPAGLKIYHMQPWPPK